ncbi:MAG: hypothetical protein KBA50_07515 [Sedimentibacter sp.]|nr:hypothetical protein [Sedimentibacter sp.]
MTVKRPRVLLSTILAILLIIAFVSGCTYTGKSHVTITALTDEELSYFNGDEFFNGEYLNIRNQFLSSTYERPEKIDIFELFYCGSGIEETATEEERAAVVAYNNWDMEPDCACTKISRSNMESVLGKYMGLALADTEGIGLENITYLEEYDAYYYYHGDTNYRGKITFSGGEREGDIIRLFYDDVFLADGKKVLTLKEKDGSYLFVSNVYSDNANAHASEESTNEENAVPLRFEKLENEQKIKAEDNMHIGTVLLNESVDGGRAYIYEKVGEKENLHGGFTAGEAFYDLGAVGDLQGFLNELMHVRTFELYGKTVVKFQGAFGSNVSNTSYFAVDRGIPVQFLSTEGITTELDIDGDGIKEIVAEMPGTVPSVKIFEWNGDSFLTAVVDEALGAESVIFNQEDGSFSAYYNKPGSEDTLAAEYYYSSGGMKPKKDFKDVGDILSVNTIDYNKDSVYEKVIIKMTEGKQYEVTEAGPFQGWNWQGKFIIQLIDDKGNEISKLDLNKAFESEELIFNSVFLLKFEDYNNDGNLDFTVGQYGSSNGNLYRLFTLTDDRIEILPVQTGTIFSSGGNSRYAAIFDKVSDIGFLNFYYDNSIGKIIKQHFVWDGSQFVLHSTSEG